MSERRPPAGRVTPQGPLVGGLRDTSTQQSTADTEAPRRSFGEPCEGLVTADRRVAYGDLVWCDPTLASGSKLTIYLPKGDGRYIGEKVTVKNYSASTNTIRVLPVYPDVIDEQAQVDMVVGWAQATFLLVSSSKWICTSSNGCTDCKGTCRATCAESCLLGCGSDCTASCGGSCSAGCGGSCSNACGASCSTGCYTTCDTGCGGECSASCGGSCSADCGGSCSADCGGECDELCGGSCTEYCGGSCSDYCGGSCDYACGGSCTTGCSGSCTGACEGSCTGTSVCSGCTGGCEATCVSGCWAYCTNETG